MSCDVNITQTQRVDLALLDGRESDALIPSRTLRIVHHLNQSNCTYKLGKRCKKAFLSSLFAILCILRTARRRRHVRHSRLAPLIQEVLGKGGERTAGKPKGPGCAVL